MRLHQSVADSPSACNPGLIPVSRRELAGLRDAFTVLRSFVWTENIAGSADFPIGAALAMGRLESYVHLLTEPLGGIPYEPTADQWDAMCAAHDEEQRLIEADRPEPFEPTTEDESAWSAYEREKAALEEIRAADPLKARLVEAARDTVYAHDSEEEHGRLPYLSPAVQELDGLVREALHLPPVSGGSPTDDDRAHALAWERGLDDPADSHDAGPEARYGYE